MKLAILSALNAERAARRPAIVVTHVESGKTIALFRCTQMILWPKR